MDIHYDSSLSLQAKDLSEHFQKLYRKQRPKELLVGSTLIGPHRDDIVIELSQKSAKEFSSEGQKRSCICSLRFAQWELMASTTGHYPMLGIDDFGIQLDKMRQQELKTHLKQFKQVFLTSPLAIAQEFSEAPHVLTINSGKVAATA